MIDFLGGALTMAYAVAATYFVRFWKRAGDRLFMMFAAAFTLLALNQLALGIIGTTDERSSYVYVLRVLAFALMVGAILDKNFTATGKSTRR